MGDIKPLGILDEIQALVSDKLQVVSYKWLSRNFLVSSNAAKRLLQEFAEKNGNGLEVVYSLSGWLKNNPSVYHIRLVLGPKLAEAKEEFDDSCSVQVYSVQACIPKDPSVLWNAEFVQAEELFKQPPTVVNCLRDNRFCGVSNSFVKRNSEGTHVSNCVPQPKSVGICEPSRTDSQPQERKFEQSGPKSGLKAPDQPKDIQRKSHGTEVHEQGSKPVAQKELVPQLPADKKKGQNDKSSSGTGGSLASMWGRASAKSKPSSASAETNNTIPISSEAQVCAREAIEDGSSDEDGREVNFKRASNGEGSRKRRVVFDFSDEDEDDDQVKDAVSLPDPPRKQSSHDSKQSSKTLIVENNNLNFDEQKEDKPKVKKEKVSNSDPNQLLREESTGFSNGKKTGSSTSDKKECSLPEDDANTKCKVTEAAPKRKKMLKTRIDERGREVTEVVWEGDETETKPDTNTTKKGDDNTVNNIVNRAPAAAKKSPAVATAPSGKAGNKKAGNKDPKQGNILSFFKKV